MIAETLEHSFIEPERQFVLQYFQHNYDDSRILIDMGKLAPLAFDSGLPLRNFIYNEGEDSVWRRALQKPETEVGWLVSEKGDEVWEKLQVDPSWARKYSLVVHTANFLVYRMNSGRRGDPPPG